MANIESRRIKRRIAKYALPAAAALLLCAVIIGSVLLKKSCDKNKSSGNSADNTEAPVVTQSVLTDSPTEAPEITAAPTTTAAAQPETATSVPEQTTEDRSLLCFVLEIGAQYGAAGVRLKGSCSVNYVNNTDSVMYAAYFTAPGFKASNASAGGLPVRFENGEDSILLPFTRELLPGESIELFFELEGVVSSEFELPAPAYDTAFDAVCFVTSERPLEFSCGEAQLQTGSGYYVYHLEAERASSVIVSF